MSKVKIDFTEGKWPICEDSPLTADLFEKYNEKYGTERAQGYVDAVIDFQKHFMRCFSGFTAEDNGIQYHQQRVGTERMVKALFHRNELLLKMIDPERLDVDKSHRPS